MTDQTTEALAEGIARSRDTDYLDMEALLSDEEKDRLRGRTSAPSVPRWTPRCSARTSSSRT